VEKSVGAQQKAELVVEQGNWDWFYEQKQDSEQGASREDQQETSSG
jgi:hypothetical protein